MKKRIITFLSTSIIVISILNSVTLFLCLKKFFKNVLNTLPQTELNSIFYSFNSYLIKILAITSLINIILILIASLLCFKITEHFLKSYNSVLSELADGKLSIFVEESGMLSFISKNINKFSKNNRKIISELTEISEKNTLLSQNLQKGIEETKIASESISLAIIDIAEGSSVQLETSIKTKENTNTMKKNTELISTNSDSTEKTAEEMLSVVDENNGIINELISKMKESAESSKELAERIFTLQNEIDKIGTITSSVNDISKKTNLLSLNAAIEAARAGDSGKGFAVVAEEVRKLAEQSSDSSEDIKKILQGIIETIKAISNNSKYEIEKISNNIIYADNAKNSLSKLQISAKTTYNSVVEIKKLSSQTANMSIEVDTLMNNVSEASEQTASASQQVSAAAQQQSANMNEMTGMVTTINNLAKNIDDYLASFKDKIQIGQKEKELISSSISTLKSMNSEILNSGASLNNLSSKLKEYHKKHPEFEYIMLMDKLGNVTAGIDDSTANKNYSHRPYYKASIAGADYHTEPYISNTSYNYATAVSIPFKDKSNHIIGVLQIDLRLN